MKKLLFLFLLISGVASAQVAPPGYTKINQRYKWIAGIFDSALHVPQYNGAPSGRRSGVWPGSGEVAVDTTNHNLYFWSDSWIRAAKASEIVSPLFPTTGTGTATGGVEGDLSGFDLDISNAEDIGIVADENISIVAGKQLALQGDDSVTIVGVVRKDEANGRNKVVFFDTTTKRISYGDESGGNSTLLPTTGTGTATGNVTGDLDEYDLDLKTTTATSGFFNGRLFLSVGPDDNSEPSFILSSSNTPGTITASVVGYGDLLLLNSSALSHNTSQISLETNIGIKILPFQGKIYIDSLASGASTDSVLVWTASTGQVKYRNAADFGGGSLFPLTGTGTATGNVTGDLDGNGLNIVNGSNFSVTVDNDMVFEGTEAGSDINIITVDYINLQAGELRFNDASLAGASVGYVWTLTNTGTGAGEWAAGGSGASAFTDLTDAPSSYTGHGGKLVAVNSGATALEFVTKAENFIDGVVALGSGMKAQALGATLVGSTGSTALTDGQARYQPVYIPNAQTITGVKFFVRTQGNFTADNNNRVALYSYSGGTLTQVATSANDGDIWKATSNTYTTVAFTSPYAATPGIYYVGFIYNNSAQTTAPALAHMTNMGNAAMGSPDLTNSAVLSAFLSSQSDISSTTQAMSGLGGSATVYYFYLY